MKARNISQLALIVAAGLWAANTTSASAGSTVITASDANVLNLLSPFLNLNSTAAGQATLTSNLEAAIATNNAAGDSPVIEAESISEATILSSASTSITLANGSASYYGPGANLAGGLPVQALQNGVSFSGSGNLTSTPANGTINPYQAVGGLGNLGGAYQAAVSPNAITTSSSTSVTSAGVGANPLLNGPQQTQNVVNLLVNAYSFTSADLGVAKFYFANGTANGTSTAVAPAGYTLPKNSNGTLPGAATSVYDIAYGVNNTQANQNTYGDSRPVQVAPGSINQYDPNAITGLTTNPSFPSGHTTYAFTDSILIGMMSPQNFQSMLLSGSEYGNSRISLGVHYPLDIIASRSFVQMDLSQLLNATASTGATQATNPYYYTNATGSTTVLNLNGSFVSATQSLNGYLNTQTASCGGSVAACAASNPYNTYSATTYAYQAAAVGVTNASTNATNAAIYQYRLTYGLPTFTYAQAPIELADTLGNTAAIELATLYGGQGNAQAQALANAAMGGASGAGLLGNLTTGAVNQIIANTEGQALQAFYGTQLSYWSRINLYGAAGYFSGVTGTLTLQTTDIVTTPVTVANTGVLIDNGAIIGQTLVSNGGMLAGAGSITGGLINHGAVAPGTPGAPGHAATPGILTVNGNYLQGSDGAFDELLAGLTAGAGYGQLVVNGSATLDGLLDVTTAADFHLAVGETFEIMEFGSLVGNFASFDFNGAACSGVFGRLDCGGVWFSERVSGGGLNLVVDSIGGVTAVPELSTWAMMLLGFGGLGFTGYRRSRNGGLAA